LNLRALSGASVLAITRGEGNVLGPTAKEILRSGDLLALTGTQEAITAARRLLEPTGENGPTS
jgi:CPA2 family monovalent cation:H+ antiporter-2